MYTCMYVCMYIHILYTHAHVYIKDHIFTHNWPLSLLNTFLCNEAGKNIILVNAALL